jgi:hypothetical protein
MGLGYKLVSDGPWLGGRVHVFVGVERNRSSLPTEDPALRALRGAQRISLCLVCLSSKTVSALSRYVSHHPGSIPRLKNMPAPRLKRH